MVIDGEGMKDRIVEILQYTLKKDSGEEFHQIMHEVSVPLHTRNGIDVVAYGNSLHDPDSYYLIRAFEVKNRWKAFLMISMRVRVGVVAHEKQSSVELNSV